MVILFSMLNKRLFMNMYSANGVVVISFFHICVQFKIIMKIYWVCFCCNFLFFIGKQISYLQCHTSEEIIFVEKSYDDYNVHKILQFIEGKKSAFISMSQYKQITNSCIFQYIKCLFDFFFFAKQHIMD